MRLLLPIVLSVLVVTGVARPLPAADPEEVVTITYEAYDEKTYPPKGRYFQIYEDYDLDVHKRPIRKIGRLKAHVSGDEALTWEQIENVYAQACRDRGADAVIDMRYSHDVDEPVKPGDDMWLESVLIVYDDQDDYGHVGFWYHNNRPEIPGVMVEMVVRGSPADEAGMLPGDIVKGVSGESTGAVNIAGKEDYRAAKFKFRADEEYRFYIERKGEPKLLTVIPRSDAEVYDWNEQFGGL